MPGAGERAIADLAIGLARNAVDGKRPGTLPDRLDVSSVARARQAEQETRDRAALVSELRGASAVVLCEVTSGQNAAKIITTIQARHGEVVTELAERARRLPLGADDALALETGGEVREDFLRCRDLAALAARLREALSIVEDVHASVLPDGLEMCLAYERTGGLYRHYWQPRAATATLGDLGTFPFWLAAAREDDLEFWLPTSGQLAQRAAEVREQQQAEQVARLSTAVVY
jgi:hypothetical protein